MPIDMEEKYLANDCIECGREFNYLVHKSDVCIYCEERGRDPR